MSFKRQVRCGDTLVRIASVADIIRANRLDGRACVPGISKP
ncbi:MAG TPA: hypothetical protein VD835_18435 [Pyrinomonadaceae bacterium]|nr:hypothetical protein [Pyrinomonadaceae bacterium]